MHASYDYSPSGQYNVTIATLEDGRRIGIDTQYGMCWGCYDATLDGIDQAALIAHAREHGKFGRRPAPASAGGDAHDEPEWRSPRGKTLSEEMDSPDSIY